MNDTLLRAAGIDVVRGGRKVLSGVDLEIVAGEVIAVLGPNGAGKSTLLETLGGTLTPSAGRLDVYGRVATALQSPDLARRNTQANVELALAWWGVPRAQRSERATQSLTALRADHLSRRSSVALSGGERRRVHLARACALRADVLLLDEPFAGLDAESRASLLEDTASVLRTSSRSVVLVVHDRAEAWALADRLIIVLDGQIAATGSAQDLLHQPPSPEVARFLGYTGEITVGDRRLFARPAHVRLNPDGALRGHVTRRTPQEDTVLIDASLPEGHLQLLCPYPGPAVGENVKIELTSDISFPS